MTRPISRSCALAARPWNRAGAAGAPSASVPRVRRFLLPVCLALTLSLLTLLPGHAGAQEPHLLLDPELRELLNEELSGEWAKEQVIHISRHSRVQGSRGYRDAANYVLEQLRAIGFSPEDSYIESFPSDLRAEYQTWISPSGWDIDDAELRMVEPREELLTRWTDLPISIMTYSNAGEATGELVWVGRGDSESDYEGVDVEGKIVLCTGYGGNVHRLAVLRHGAQAVVCYLDDDRARRHPDLVYYTGMWPRPGEEEETTFGFNLSRRQGEMLRGMLEAGERVVLHGKVEGRGLEPFYMDTPVAWIRGSTRPEEVLVFSAHLDHPKESANDNASGSGALLDMARTLHNLIDSGRMERPERSILFLWVAEYYGTMAYLDAHPEMVGRPMGGDYLGNINMDMVGEHLELLHSTMMIRRTPASNPSVLNDVVAHMAGMLDHMDIRTPRGSQSAHNYRVTEYSGGSDHMMFNALHIPGLMINHTDWTHHTSEDTPDKVDPVQLQRSEMIALSSFLHLANLSDEQAVELAWYAGSHRAGRLAEAGHRAQRRIAASARGELAREWAEVENMLRHTLEWEKESLATILHFRDTAPAREAVGASQRRLDRLHEELRTDLRRQVADQSPGADAPPPLEAREDTRIPHRLTRGPLQSHNLPLPQRDLPPDRAAWYASGENPLSGMHRMEIVNFMDGRRTISEIRHAVSASYGPVPTEAVARFVDDLVQVGVVDLR
jgi:aminopeptidase YwaD